MSASLMDESDVYVVDMDWNDHYAKVGATLELKVSFGVIYDREDKEITSPEVKEAKWEKEY
jgi:hypothetical protein